MTSTFLGSVLRVTAGPVIAALFRTRVRGRENVPQGPAILAGNHWSYADPVLLWCVSPRRVHMMGKAELWDSPVLRWALPRCWGFPVRRGTPDREAILKASAVLSEGELLGIFPEGTRDHVGVGEGQAGAAYLAVRSGVPIVPVGISGTERIRPKGSRMIRFPKVTIVFGEALAPSWFEGVGRRERIAGMTEEMMRRITAAVARANES